MKWNIVGCHDNDCSKNIILTVQKGDCFRIRRDVILDCLQCLSPLELEWLWLDYCAVDGCGTSRSMLTYIYWDTSEQRPIPVDLSIIINWIDIVSDSDPGGCIAPNLSGGD